MIGIGFALLFGGYSVLAYGWSQVRGCNAGVLEVIWPFTGYRGCKPDSGSAVVGGRASVPGSTPPQLPPPGTTITTIPGTGTKTQRRRQNAPGPVGGKTVPGGGGYQAPGGGPPISVLG